MVVNAANADKDMAWLQAVHSGKFLIDRKHPDIKAAGPVLIQDLKASTSGQNQRVNLALQGPCSSRFSALSREQPLNARNLLISGRWHSLRRKWRD